MQVFDFKVRNVMANLSFAQSSFFKCLSLSQNLEEHLTYT